MVRRGWCHVPVVAQVVVEVHAGRDDAAAAARAFDRPCHDAAPPLEDGPSYDKAKMLAFLNEWGPKKK